MQPQAFSFETGLNIDATRSIHGRSMQLTHGAMAAMIGGDPSKVEELAQESNVDVANFNAPGQIVPSGTVEGIESRRQCKSKGIKLAKKLDVAGAFTRLMQTAQTNLPVLEGLHADTSNTRHRQLQLTK